MTRQEVREFIEAGVNAITPVHAFGCGLVTDFNWLADKTLPQTWLELSEVTGENPVRQAPLDTWDISLYVVKQDAQDSLPVAYNSIVEDCDLVAQKLAAQYNFIVSGYKLVTITNRKRTPIVKKFAHIMTGVILTFRLNAPDTTAVCP